MPAIRRSTSPRRSRDALQADAGTSRAKLADAIARHAGDAAAPVAARIVVLRAAAPPTLRAAAARDRVRDLGFDGRLELEGRPAPAGGCRPADVAGWLARARRRDRGPAALAGLLAAGRPELVGPRRRGARIEDGDEHDHELTGAASTGMGERRPAGPPRPGPSLEQLSAVYDIPVQLSAVLGKTTCR